MTHAQNGFIIGVKYPPPDDPYLIKVCDHAWILKRVCKGFLSEVIMQSCCKTRKGWYSLGSSKVEEGRVEQSQGAVSKNFTPFQYSIVSIWVFSFSLLGAERNQTCPLPKEDSVVLMTNRVNCFLPARMWIVKKHANQGLRSQWEWVGNETKHAFPNFYMEAVLPPVSLLFVQQSVSHTRRCVWVSVSLPVFA